MHVTSAELAELTRRIEALIAGDSSRLVVAVSHVPELRERIEDLIVLDRDPLTGDTRIRRS